MNAIQQRAAMERQNSEFDALNILTVEWRRLQMTPVVDDDYPMVRSSYEGALYGFLRACGANGRAVLPTRDAPVMYMELKEAEVGTPPVVVSSTADAVIEGMRMELIDAMVKWPPMNSAHEGWGVIYEEFIVELGAHVWTKQSKRDLPAMRKEALQVAAMALRFALDVCNEERGRK